MNRSANCRKLGIAVVSAAWLLAVPVAWAVDEHHPDQNAGPAAAAPPVSAKDTEKALQQMKQNADKLRAQTDRILKTKDPAERRRLLQEHAQTLRASLATTVAAMGGRPRSGETAGGMMGHGTMGGEMMDCPMMDQKMGGGMMDCPMMSDMMGGAGGGAANQAITDRLNQMEKRLDVMQMMIEDMRKK